LTQSVEIEREKFEERLLFLYVKQVPDYYPADNIYWYPHAGKGGQAKTVWPGLSVKNWVGCGKDQVILKWVEAMLRNKSFNTEDGVMQVLEIADYERISTNTDDQKQRYDTPCEHLSSKHNSLIPASFNHEVNLDILCGYQSDTSNLGLLHPFGFFDKGFIYDHLNRDIWGVIEHRSPYLTFQGVKSSSIKGRGSKVFQGFYQANFAPNSLYTVTLHNNDKTEIGHGTINSDFGYFTIETREHNSKGSVEVIHGDKVEKRIDFVFIQDIDFKIHPSNKTYKDVYGQDHMISSKHEARPKEIQSITWHRNTFASPIEADRKLSAIFKNLFDYLGPRILIADPYFLGHIEKSQAPVQFVLKADMISFFNALVHSSMEMGIERLDVLGCSRAAQNPDVTASDGMSKLETILTNYEEYLSGIIRANKIEKILGKEIIQFRCSNEKFHNRYWFSQIEKDGKMLLDKCVVVTNSLGNLDELDILSVSDESQLRTLQMRFSALLGNSEVRIRIK
jgi:hypothetical protein